MNIATGLLLLSLLALNAPSILEPLGEGRDSGGAISITVAESRGDESPEDPGIVIRKSADPIPAPRSIFEISTRVTELLGHFSSAITVSKETPLPRHQRVVNRFRFDAGHESRWTRPREASAADQYASVTSTPAADQTRFTHC